MLTAIWLLPVAGALAVALGPRRVGRWIGLAAALATLGLTLAVVARFNVSHRGYQFVTDLAWVGQYGISYHLGVDGISVWLLVLNAFLTVIAILATGDGVPRRNGFIALLLLLEAGMAGVFEAADLLLFYVFWEAQLVPAYFLLWQWGEGPRASRAALQFVLYTLVGSLLALVGVILEYVFAGVHTFDLATLAAHPPAAGIQFALFFLFGLAFAIKVPLFPFHGWLPQAYEVAPAPLLVTFAGVMGKTGAYAMLRILVGLFPHPVGAWNWDAVVPVLAMLAIGWGALMALNQRDTKLLVAYSSVSHMGFIVLGIFSLTQVGQQGALLQMVNHGLIIAALFLIVAWVAERTGTRDRSVLRHLAPRMPVLAGVFMIVTLAALGLPGLNSFVGEFMTLLGAWQFAPWVAVVSALGLLLAPVYMLRLFQGLMYVHRGERLEPAHATVGGGPGAQQASPVATRLPDLRPTELLTVVPLVLLMFLLGFYPNLLVQLMNSLGYVLPVPWR
jgi:NADH-quinone oxidoreductase subunit M